MANKKAPPKRAAKTTPNLVQPLSIEHKDMLMGLIGNAAFKGDDVETVCKLKLEVLRVSGVS